MDRRTVIKMLGSLVAAGLPLSLLDTERAASVAARPQQVTAGLLEGLRTISDQLLARRHAVPPDALIGPVRGHLAYLRTLLDGPAPPAVQRELGGLTAETAVFAGLTEFSAGHKEQARGYYAFARALAEEFGHPAVGAHALMKESLLHSRLLFATSPRDSEIALAMLGRAAATPSPLPAAMRASLAAQRAEEHAQLKQVDAYHRALEEAQRAVGQVTHGDRPDLLSGWTEPRLAAYEGSCLLLLGEARAAASALETALQDPGLSPSIRLMAHVDLGAARVEQGEAAEGARLIGAAFEEASEVRRTLVQRRARRALSRLERWRSEPAVRDLDGLIRAA